ncbi:conserved protein of unknown function [Pseudodesulfovibrio piezophilus C1TLV30]|uniref:Uncharacterized protein n=2 Tax=Pseudodesulfovibrio TaxID=2035811 RepID=M1WNX9_PSEP2|nr:conserved protein of unknown function [Pseudodesulfovibrio piezophilus C1TLV30]
MFDSEQALVDLLKEQLPGPLFQKSDETLVLDEVNLGYGIADLVITQYLPPKPLMRNNFFSNLHITILELLKNVRSATLPCIEDKTRASKRSINRCVEALIEDAYVSLESDVVRLEREYYCSIKNTIAIEAKLKNWKRALNQAYRYKSFSNESYVCLPVSNSRPALNNLHLFKQMEVGLLTLRDCGDLDIIYAPPSEQPISSKMNMLLNEQVLTKLHSS